MANSLAVSTISGLERDAGARSRAAACERPEAALRGVLQGVSLQAAAQLRSFKLFPFAAPSGALPSRRTVQP
jgi:hypothetical protein